MAAPFVELRVIAPRRFRTRFAAFRKESRSPWDGANSGELEIRGPWIASQYYESPDQAIAGLRTGGFRHGRRRND